MSINSGLGSSLLLSSSYYYFSNQAKFQLIPTETCLIKFINYKMKTVIPLLLFLLPLALSISQYDFNACRISNCNAEEINCLSDESGCLNYFATMRNCFSGCGNSKNWNSCWGSCKNSGARSNSYYLSMSLCYENICYLAGQWLILAASLLMLFLII